MSDFTIYKAPSEIKDFVFDFTGKIPADATLSGATVSVENYNGGRTEGMATATVPARTDKAATVRIAAGGLGRIYAVTVSATVSDGQTINEFRLLKIIDLRRNCV